MVRPSFVPPPPIRELRELTRYRKTQIDARAAEIQRLEKVLQDAGIKLTSVASKVLTLSGRAMIEAMIEGERDPAALAALAQGKMRPKIPALTEALTGHSVLTTLSPAVGSSLTSTSSTKRSVRLPSRSTLGPPPSRRSTRQLLPVPGFDRLTIDVIVAETGADMTRFPTAADLASWTGVLPGELRIGRQAPQRRHHPRQPMAQTGSDRVRPSSGTDQGKLLGAQYRQIARRRGPNKAAVAVAHSLIELVWHLLSTGEVFKDLGDDYFTKRQDPERQARRLVAQLEDLGYTVALTAPPAIAA